MHSFVELIDRSTQFTLGRLQQTEREISDKLQTSSATYLIKSLQMLQLQRAIMAVGMFSVFEAILQDRLGCDDGFIGARKHMNASNQLELAKRFELFAAAINVLKHGRGRSYETLLSEADALPFRIKRPDENFFMEGNVSEIQTLVEVDDKFVMNCADLITRVSAVMP